MDASVLGMGSVGALEYGFALYASHFVSLHTHSVTKVPVLCHSNKAHTILLNDSLKKFFSSEK